MNLIMKSFFQKYNIHLFWAAVILFAPLLTFSGLSHESYWADEGFSIAITESTYSDIWLFSSEDSNPPFFYIALKFFTSIFGTSKLSFRFFPLLGMIAASIGLGIGPVRRIMGPGRAALYALLMLLAPNFISYAQEVRTYTWSLFLVGGVAFWGYLFFHNGKKRDLISFTVTSILALYIHYYAAMGVFFIYLFLGTGLIIRRKQWAKVLYITLSAVVVLIAFIPWASTFADRIAVHSQGFWIEKPTQLTVVQCLSVPFNLKFGPSAYAPYLTVFAFVLILTGSVKSHRRGEKYSLLGFLALFIIFATLLTGYIYSHEVQPMLIPRYMLALYSPFFAAVSVGIAEFKAARFRVGIPGVFLLFSIPSLIGIYTLRLNGPSDEVSEYIRNRGNTDDIVVHFDELTASPLAVLLHEKQHVVYLPQSSSSYFNFKVYSKNLTVTDDIESYMNGKKNIWLVSRSPSPNHEAYIKTMKYLGF